MASILIVDDDEDWLVLLRDYLRSFGHKCSLATDTKVARYTLWLAKPTLVISDYQMPGESGLEFLQYVSTVYPDLPFILLTGCEDRSLRSKAIGMGAYSCLSKSLKFADLLRVITEATHVKNGLPKNKLRPESRSILHS